MAVTRDEISYGEFLAIFGEKDEENETLHADASDFDEDISVCNLIDLKEGETSEQEAEEDEWNIVCDLTFETLAFNPSISGIQVPILENPLALFFFQSLFDNNIIELVIAESNRLTKTKTSKQAGTSFKVV